MSNGDGIIPFPTATGEDSIGQGFPMPALAGPSEVTRSTTIILPRHPHSDAETGPTIKCTMTMSNSGSESLIEVVDGPTLDEDEYAHILNLISTMLT